jgi:thiol-disulfide isomerase/thioredoxin
MNYKLSRFFSFTFFFISTIAFGQSVNERQVDSIMNAWHKQVLFKPLPAFIAAGNNGVVNNDSLKGKVTFINMWEEYCAPCMAEMGALNELYDTLNDNPNFQFISITSDNMETIQKIKAKYHIPYNVYHLDEEGCFQLNSGMGYPTYLIVNEKALLKYAHAGGSTDAVSIWRFIFSDEIYPAIRKELH